MRAVANSNRQRANARDVATEGSYDHPTAPSREFLERQAFDAFRAFVGAFQRLLASPLGPAESRAPRVVALPEAVVSKAASAVDASGSDVMTADEVAVFLGVDRNTVYDYAGRGVIPHQRIGKRLLFRRGGVVAWLDSSLCKATSTRKG